MEILSPTIISSFNSALAKLTGYHRRKYVAELTMTYFSGSARKAERYLCVLRALDKQYEKGIKLSRKQIERREDLLIRKLDLPKWDVWI